MKLTSAPPGPRHCYVVNSEDLHPVAELEQPTQDPSAAGTCVVDSLYAVSASRKGKAITPSSKYLVEDELDQHGRALLQAGQRTAFRYGDRHYPLARPHPPFVFSEYPKLWGIFLFNLHKNLTERSFISTERTESQDRCDWLGTRRFVVGGVELKSQPCSSALPSTVAVVTLAVRDPPSAE